LQRSRRLVLSLTADTADSIIRAEPDSLTFGTSLFYAQLHQSLSPRRKLPRRAIFDLTEEQKTQLANVIQRRLAALGRAEGLPIVTSVT